MYITWEKNESNPGSRNIPIEGKQVKKRGPAKHPVEERRIEKKISILHEHKGGRGKKVFSWRRRKKPHTEDCRHNRLQFVSDGPRESGSSVASKRKSYHGIDPRHLVADKKESRGGAYL